MLWLFNAFLLLIIAVSAVVSSTLTQPSITPPSVEPAGTDAFWYHSKTDRHHSSDLRVAPDSNCNNLRNNYQDIPLTDYSGPINITKGGVYSGNWRSGSQAIPAVFINTLDTVLITNCRIRSAGDLISDYFGGLYGAVGNVTVTNCYGYGEDSMVSGTSRGAFIYLHRWNSFNISNNYMESTNGVMLKNGKGPVSIMYNCVHNIGGLVSRVTPNGLCAVGHKNGTSHTLPRYPLPSCTNPCTL